MPQEQMKKKKSKARQCEPSETFRRSDGHLAVNPIVTSRHGKGFIDNSRKLGAYNGTDDDYTDYDRVGKT